MQREHYTIPTLEDITRKLSGCDTFSALDAAGGYNQISLDRVSMRLTTFIMPVGRVCYKGLPFRLSSASEIFQRKMIEAIGERPGVACYQDDVIVAGKGQEHDKRLNEVMHTLRERGLKLNLSKCRFRKRELEFLGHVFTKDGMKPDSTKVQAILDLAPPTDVTELRRIMGTVNFLGKYVPHLSSVAKPITDLLRNYR